MLITAILIVLMTTISCVVLQSMMKEEESLKLEMRGPIRRRVNIVGQPSADLWLILRNKFAHSTSRASTMSFKSLKSSCAN